MHEILALYSIPGGKNVSFRSRIHRLYRNIEAHLDSAKSLRNFVCYYCKRKSHKRFASDLSNTTVTKGLCPGVSSIDQVQQDLLRRYISTDSPNQASLGWGITETLFRRLNLKWSQDASDGATFVDMFPAYSSFQELLRPQDYRGTALTECTNRAVRIRRALDGWMGAPHSAISVTV
jgi:hypothetical protein